MIVVVGYRAELVREALAGQTDVEFVEQTEQLGTGHAVKMCRPRLARHDGAGADRDRRLAADAGLDSVAGAVRRVRSGSAGLRVGDAAQGRSAPGWGGSSAIEAGEFLAIVEEKDATPEQRAIREVNMSTYVFDCRSWWRRWISSTNRNRQKEYYITDCPGILKRAGRATCGRWPVLKPCEALSVNTVEDLAIVEAEMQKDGTARHARTEDLQRPSQPAAGQGDLRLSEPSAGRDLAGQVPRRRESSARSKRTSAAATSS